MTSLLIKKILFVYFVVNFLSQVIFVFLLFLANEVETKEKEKFPEIKKLTATYTCKHNYSTSQRQIMSKQKYQYVNWAA